MKYLLNFVRDHMNTQYHLLSSINFQFYDNKVKSLLAYKIALMIILELLDDEFDQEFFLPLESMAELASLFQGFEFRHKIRTASSIQTALKGLEDASVIFNEQVSPDIELLETGDYKDKNYLLLNMPVKSLLQLALLDNYKTEISNITKFNDLQLKLIKCLNLLSSDGTPSLLAYQISLFFISQMDDGDVERECIVRWYKTTLEFSKSLTPFIRLNADEIANESDSDSIEQLLINIDTIEDNLFILNKWGFVHSWRESPGEYDLPGYKTKEYLMFEIDFKGIDEILSTL